MGTKLNSFSYLFYRELRGLSSSQRVADPCLPRGLQLEDSLNFNNLPKEVPEVHRKRLSTGESIEVFLVGSGDWDICYSSLAQFTKSRELYSK